MSEPIINPIWIYLIGFCDNFRVLLGVSISILIMISVISIAIYYCQKYIDCDEDIDVDKDVDKESDGQILGKKLKTVGISIVIVALLLAVVPTKEVCYTMLVSNCITEENLSKAGGLTKEAVDYVFEKIEDVAGSVNSKGGE